MGKRVTRPGTSIPTALLFFLERFRLLAERDIFLNLRLAFPGEEVHHRLLDGSSDHVRKNGIIQADVQFLCQERHGFKLWTALASFYLNNCANTHVEPLR